MKIFCFIANLLFVAVVFGQTTEDEIQSLDYEPDIEPYESLMQTEKPIFKYQKNGIKLDLKIVSSANDTLLEDDFPNFPTKDIGVCILDLSLTCVQRRFHHFLHKVRTLKEITLLGNWVKLVRAKEPAHHISERRSHDSKYGMTDIISRDIDSFFDVFALRINLPSIQGKKKKNQIDVMFDETGLVEGRGKSGKGGKGGGGKCKKMMMMMLMMVKMKMMGMMGMTAMKGMMMAGMSLMISKWMLIQKLMDAKKGGGGGGGGGGPWQGGGGGGGGSGLKEIVLLTKSAGGGGGGGAGCCGGGGGGGAPMDSYGAPPPSGSYGAPGGGYDSGGGGGGGWGRSFNSYTSPSNIISHIIPPSEVGEKDHPGVVGDTLSANDMSHLVTPKIDIGAAVDETINSVHVTDNSITSSNSSRTRTTPRQFSKNTTDGGVTTPSPLQRQFVTLRSNFQVVPTEDSRDVPTEDNVQNPLYFHDWKNFELVKRWRPTPHSSIKSDQGVKRSGQDSVDRKYDYIQNQQPYGGLIENRNIIFHGL